MCFHAHWCILVQELIGSCAHAVLAELQREAIPEGGWADVAAQVATT